VVVGGVCEAIKHRSTTMELWWVEGHRFHARRWCSRVTPSTDAAVTQRIGTFSRRTAARVTPSTDAAVTRRIGTFSRRTVAR
jgi:hypothetical protein